jgi:hypothetical protein
MLGREIGLAPPIGSNSELSNLEMAGSSESSDRAATATSSVLEF